MGGTVYFVWGFLAETGYGMPHQERSRMKSENSLACTVSTTMRNDPEIRSLMARLAAWGDLIFRDHGFFRTFYLNFHALPDGLYRSAQPSPNHIRWLHRQYGIRTIVNLRGASNTGRYALEAETCRDLGIELINHFGIRSRGAPEVAVLQSTRRLFDTITYPALIHCKSGADRVGFASALYRIFRCGDSVATAMQELNLKYGHIKTSKTGILDAFFREYLASAPDNREDLLTWAETAYNQDALKSSFRPFVLQDLLVDKVILRE